MKILFNKIINKLLFLLYVPICKAYARHLGDKPADVFFRLLCSIPFMRSYHFWPNFVQPRTFSEKVWSRQLHTRDPKLTMISDKFQVRNYVAEKLGNTYLVPLLWDGDRPEEIPFDKLPNKFVIKTNHGCEYNIIIKDKTHLDKKKVTLQLKKWLDENFCNKTFLGIAWAYKNIKPHIIIESFLEENGKAPLDYKFFCFSGRMEFFKIDFARFEDHAATYFDRKLNKLDLIEIGFKQYQGKIELPNDFEDMIRVAESLSEGFDFIRVDLYYVNNKIYFSELTPYPGGISQKLDPVSFDYIFGEKWRDFKCD
jgi:hypothetical protein